MLEPENSYCVTTFEEALIVASSYRYKLEQLAQKYHSLGKRIDDNDYPTEILALRPKPTQKKPLVLIGGMGALAGITGFELACQIFQNSREILLLQACALPNRTTAMFQKLQQEESGSLAHQLVLMLAKAIQIAVSQIDNKNTSVRVIVLCNAAHCFLPSVWQQLQKDAPEILPKIQLISLIESAVQDLQQRNLKKPLLLCTNATRWGRIYTEPLESKNIEILEPNETLQLLLMDSIYRGVKAYNQSWACQIGEKFWLNLLETQPDIDCIIAGCSEIPSLLTWLKTESSVVVRQFLSATEVIDPVRLALSSS